MTELGEIPEAWEVGRLGEISKITMGQSPIGNSYNSIGEGIPLLNGPTEFTNKYPIPKQWTTKPTKLCSKKDILFCVRGSSTGRMNIANDKYCIGRGLASIRGKEEYSKIDFIYQTMIFNIDSILSSCEGSTFPNISRDKLNNLIIAVPPLGEQKKISLILHSVDEKIENTDNLIEKTKELKRGLMQMLLTKGIIQERFKETEIGKIPEEWKVKRIGEISKLITKGTTPSTMGFDFVKDGINYIRAGNINQTGNFEGEFLKISDECNEKLSRSIIKENDILVSIVGFYLGKTALVSSNEALANTNQNLAIVRIINSNYCNGYIKRIFESNLFKKYIRKNLTEGAQPSLSLKQIGDFKIPIPKKEEQQKISLILSTIDDKIEQYEIKKEKLQDLKKGLIQKLLTGKIRVK